jgi:hypothetical protein
MAVRVRGASGGGAARLHQKRKMPSSGIFLRRRVRQRISAMFSRLKSTASPLFI